MSNHDRTATSNGDQGARRTSDRVNGASAVTPSVRSRQAVGLVVSMEGRLNCDGLVALLSTQPDFNVLGSAESCAETLTLCSTLQPRVLVLGILNTWPRELQPIATIRLASPMTEVLALSPHGQDRCTYLNPPVPAGSDSGVPAWSTHSTCLPRALSRGALGALDGDATPEMLFEAVRTVARGERWRPAGLASANGNGHPLSPQELRVARLIGRGASNKEIAATLEISDLTVKKHLGSIFQKLDLHDRLQLGVHVARNPTAFDCDDPTD
jgi:DNA-binding NarL/FixJ family response regulator